MSAHGANRPELLPIETIVAMLTDKIADLARDLLPQGFREGNEWVGSIRVEKTPSLKIRIRGDKAGVWADFGSGQRGDALDLVANLMCSGNKSEAIKWARAWLGLAGLTPAQIEQRKRQAQELARQREESAEVKASETRNNAFRIWLSAHASIADTPVETYLRGRGIDLRALGRQPGALRYHPSLWSSEAKCHLPAMVAAVNDGIGNFCAVHRTYLAVHSFDRVTKAELEQPKMALGRWSGGMIRLARGASGKPIAQAMPDETLDITEGIEDGLSVAVALPEARVCAALSLSNLATVPVPENIWTLRIWRQADTNPQAIAQFEKAVSAWLERGKAVVIPELPEGIKDVNDWLKSPERLTIGESA